MSRTLRYGAALLGVALAVVAGWRVVATRVADALAATSPAQALAWDAGAPEARLALAQAQLAADHPRQAAATARALLRHSPLQADAIAVLARAAAAQGDTAGATRLFALAVQRAPRNQYARAWMIGEQLQAHAWRAALHNVDVLFGFAPRQESALVPILAAAASRQPAFATALGQHLAAGAAWRPAMLAEVLAHAPLATVDQVFDALQAAGHNLPDAEARAYFARLEQDGQWGEAYSRWLDWIGVDLRHGVPLVFNGSFARPVTGTAFDWSLGGEPGVEVERVADADSADGYVARVVFRQRRADNMGFQQTLLLAPGRYTLTFRARADDLRSDQGLAWNVTCVTGGLPLAASPRLEGSFAWKTFTAGFSVPANGCPAQRLALVNPGAGGSAKVVSGTLWVDAFAITPDRTPPAPPQAGTAP